MATPTTLNPALGAGGLPVDGGVVADQTAETDPIAAPDETAMPAGADTIAEVVEAEAEPLGHPDITALVPREGPTDVFVPPNSGRDDAGALPGSGGIGSGLRAVSERATAALQALAGRVITNAQRLSPEYLAHWRTNLAALPGHCVMLDGTPTLVLAIHEGRASLARVAPEAVDAYALIALDDKDRLVLKLLRVRSDADVAVFGRHLADALKKGQGLKANSAAAALAARLEDSPGTLSTSLVNSIVSFDVPGCGPVGMNLEGLIPAAAGTPMAAILTFEDMEGYHNRLFMRRNGSVSNPRTYGDQLAIGGDAGGLIFQPQRVYPYGDGVVLQAMDGFLVLENRAGTWHYSFTTDSTREIQEAIIAQGLSRTHLARDFRRIPFQRAVAGIHLTIDSGRVLDFIDEDLGHVRVILATDGTAQLMLGEFRRAKSVLQAGVPPDANLPPGPARYSPKWFADLTKDSPNVVWSGAKKIYAVQIYDRRLAGFMLISDIGGGELGFTLIHRASKDAKPAMCDAVEHALLTDSDHQIRAPHDFDRFMEKSPPTRLEAILTPGGCYQDINDPRNTWRGNVHLALLNGEIHIEVADATGYGRLVHDPLAGFIFLDPSHDRSATGPQTSATAPDLLALPTTGPAAEAFREVPADGIEDLPFHEVSRAEITHPSLADYRLFENLIYGLGVFFHIITAGPNAGMADRFGIYSLADGLPRSRRTLYSAQIAASSPKTVAAPLTPGIHMHLNNAPISAYKVQSGGILKISLPGPPAARNDRRDLFYNRDLLAASWDGEVYGDFDFTSMQRTTPEKRLTRVPGDTRYQASYKLIVKGELYVLDLVCGDQYEVREATFSTTHPDGSTTTVKAAISDYTPSLPIIKTPKLLSQHLIAARLGDTRVVVPWPRHSGFVHRQVRVLVQDIVATTAAAVSLSGDTSDSPDGSAGDPTAGDDTTNGGGSGGAGEPPPDPKPASSGAGTPRHSVPISAAYLRSLKEGDHPNCHELGGSHYLYLEDPGTADNGFVTLGVLLRAQGDKIELAHFPIVPATLLADPAQLGKYIPDGLPSGRDARRVLKKQNEPLMALRRFFVADKQVKGVDRKGIQKIVDEMFNLPKHAAAHLTLDESGQYTKANRVFRCQGRCIIISGEPQDVASPPAEWPITRLALENDTDKLIGAVKVNYMRGPTVEVRQTLLSAPDGDYGILVENGEELSFYRVSQGKSPTMHSQFQQAERRFREGATGSQAIDKTGFEFSGVLVHVTRGGAPAGEVFETDADGTPIGVELMGRCVVVNEYNATRTEVLRTQIFHLIGDNPRFAEEVSGLGGAPAEPAPAPATAATPGLATRKPVPPDGLSAAELLPVDLSGVPALADWQLLESPEYAFGVALKFRRDPAGTLTRECLEATTYHPDGAPIRLYRDIVTKANRVIPLKGQTLAVDTRYDLIGEGAMRGQEFVTAFALWGNGTAAVDLKCGFPASTREKIFHDDLLAWRAPGEDYGDDFRFPDFNITKGEKSGRDFIQNYEFDLAGTPCTMKVTVGPDYKPRKVEFQPRGGNWVVGAIAKYQPSDPTVRQGGTRDGWLFTARIGDQRVLLQWSSDPPNITHGGSVLVQQILPIRPVPAPAPAGARPLTPDELVPIPTEPLSAAYLAALRAGDHPNVRMIDGRPVMYLETITIPHGISLDLPPLTFTLITPQDDGGINVYMRMIYAPEELAGPVFSQEVQERAAKVGGIAELRRLNKIHEQWRQFFTVAPEGLSAAVRATVSDGVKKVLFGPPRVGRFEIPAGTDRIQTHISGAELSLSGRQLIYENKPLGHRSPFFSPAECPISLPWLESLRGKDAGLILLKFPDAPEVRWVLLDQTDGTGHALVMRTESGLFMVADLIGDEGEETARILRDYIDERPSAHSLTLQTLQKLVAYLETANAVKIPQVGRAIGNERGLICQVRGQNLVLTRHRGSDPFDIIDVRAYHVHGTTFFYPKPRAETPALAAPVEPLSRRLARGLMTLRDHEIHGLRVVNGKPYLWLEDPATPVNPIADDGVFPCLLVTVEDGKVVVVNFNIQGAAQMRALDAQYRSDPLNLATLRIANTNAKLVHVFMTVDPAAEARIGNKQQWDSIPELLEQNFRDQRGLLPIVLGEDNETMAQPSPGLSCTVSLTPDAIRVVKGRESVTFCTLGGGALPLAAEEIRPSVQSPSSSAVVAVPSIADLVPLPTEPITAEYLLSLKPGDHPDFRLFWGRPYMLFVDAVVHPKARLQVVVASAHRETSGGAALRLVSLVSTALPPPEGRGSFLGSHLIKWGKILRLFDATPLPVAEEREAIDLLKNEFTVPDPSGILTWYEIPSGQSRVTKDLQGATAEMAVSGRTIAHSTHGGWLPQASSYSLVPRSEFPLTLHWLNALERSAPGFMVFTAAVTQRGTRRPLAPPIENRVQLLENPGGEPLLIARDGNRLALFMGHTTAVRDMVGLIKRQSGQPAGPMAATDVETIKAFAAIAQMPDVFLPGDGPVDEVRDGNINPPRGYRIVGPHVVVTTYDATELSRAVAREVYSIPGMARFKPIVTATPPTTTGTRVEEPIALRLARRLREMRDGEIPGFRIIAGRPCLLLENEATAGAHLMQEDSSWLLLTLENDRLVGIGLQLYGPDTLNTMERHARERARDDITHLRTIARTKMLNATSRIVQAYLGNPLEDTGGIDTAMVATHIKAMVEGREGFPPPSVFNVSGETKPSASPTTPLYLTPAGVIAMTGPGTRAIFVGLGGRALPLTGSSAGDPAAGPVLPPGAWRLTRVMPASCGDPFLALTGEYEEVVLYEDGQGRGLAIFLHEQDADDTEAKGRRGVKLARFYYHPAGTEALGSFADLEAFSLSDEIFTDDDTPYWGDHFSLANGARVTNPAGTAVGAIPDMIGVSTVDAPWRLADAETRRSDGLALRRLMNDPFGPARGAPQGETYGRMDDKALDLEPVGETQRIGRFHVHHLKSADVTGLPYALELLVEEGRDGSLNRAVVTYKDVVSDTPVSLNAACLPRPDLGKQDGKVIHLIHFVHGDKRFFIAWRNGNKGTVWARTIESAEPRLAIPAEGLKKTFCREITPADGYAAGTGLENFRVFESRVYPVGVAVEFAPATQAEGDTPPVATRLFIYQRAENSPATLEDILRRDCLVSSMQDGQWQTGRHFGIDGLGFRMHIVLKNLLAISLKEFPPARVELRRLMRISEMDERYGVPILGGAIKLEPEGDVLESGTPAIFAIDLAAVRGRLLLDHLPDQNFRAIFQDETGQPTTLQFYVLTDAPGYSFISGVVNGHRLTLVSPIVARPGGGSTVRAERTVIARPITNLEEVQRARALTALDEVIAKIATDNAAIVPNQMVVGWPATLPADEWVEIAEQRGLALCCDSSATAAWSETFAAGASPRNRTFAIQVRWGKDGVTSEYDLAVRLVDATTRFFLVPRITAGSPAGEIEIVRAADGACSLRFPHDAEITRHLAKPLEKVTLTPTRRAGRVHIAIAGNIRAGYLRVMLDTIASQFQFEVPLDITEHDERNVSLALPESPQGILFLANLLEVLAEGLQTTRTQIAALPLPTWQRVIDRYPVTQRGAAGAGDGGLELGICRTRAEGTTSYVLDAAVFRHEPAQAITGGTLAVNGQVLTTAGAIALSAGDTITVRRDAIPGEKDKTTAPSHGWEDITYIFHGDSLEIAAGSDHFEPYENQVVYRAAANLANQRRTYRNALGREIADGVFSLDLELYNDFRAPEAPPPLRVRRLALNLHLDPAAIGLSRTTDFECVTQPEDWRQGGEVTFAANGLGVIRFQVSLDGGILHVTRLADPQDTLEAEPNDGAIVVAARAHIKEFSPKKKGGPRGTRDFQVVRPEDTTEILALAALAGQPMQLKDQEVLAVEPVDPKDLPPRAAASGGGDDQDGNGPDGEGGAATVDNFGTAEAGRFRFVPTRLNRDGSRPLRSIYLRRKEYLVFREAFDGIGAHLAEGAEIAEFAVKPPDLSVLPIIDIPPGTVFTMTADTLDWIAAALDCSRFDPARNLWPFGDRAPLFRELPDGRREPLRLEFETEEGLVISVPVRFRHREHNPFEIDTERRIETYVRGHPETRRPVDAQVIQEEQGGNWRIYAHMADPVTGVHKAFNLAVVHGAAIADPTATERVSGAKPRWVVSPVLFGLVNLSERPTSPTDTEETLRRNEKEYRNNGRNRINERAVQVLGAARAGNLPAATRLGHVRVEKAGKIVRVAFGSETPEPQAGKRFLELSGIALDRHSHRLDFDDTVRLGEYEWVEVPAADGGTSWEKRLIAAFDYEHTLADRRGIIRLTQVVTAGRPRIYEWNLLTGILTELTPPEILEDAQVARTGRSLRNLNLPFLETAHWRKFSEAGEDAVGERPCALLEIITDYPPPLADAEEEGILLPPAHRIRAVTDPAQAAELLQRFDPHGEFALPDMASIATAIAGRHREGMVFQLPDGELLLVPMTERPEHPYDYLPEVVADPIKGQGGTAGTPAGNGGKGPNGTSGANGHGRNGGSGNGAGDGKAAANGKAAHGGTNRVDDIVMVRYLVPNPEFIDDQLAEDLKVSAYKPAGGGAATTLKFTDPQHEALARLDPWLQDIAVEAATQTATVAMPTGSGKTMVAAGACEVLAAYGAWPDGDKVFVCANQEDLIDQLSAEFTRFFPHKQVTRVQAGTVDFSGDIVILSVQTVTHKKFDLQAQLEAALGSEKKIALTIFDEWHHGEADTWQDIVARLRTTQPGMPVLGLTATPRDTDPNILVDIKTRDLIRRKVLPNGRLVEIDGVALRDLKKPADLDSSHDLMSPVRHRNIMEAIERHGVTRRDNRRQLSPCQVTANSIAHAATMALYYQKHFGRDAEATDAYRDYIIRARPLTARRIAIVGDGKDEPAITAKAEDIRRLLQDKRDGKIDTIVAVASSRLTAAVRRLIFENWQAGLIETVFTAGLWIEGADLKFVRNFVDAQATMSEQLEAQKKGRMQRYDAREIDRDEGRIVELEERVWIDVIDRLEGRPGSGEFRPLAVMRDAFGLDRVPLRGTPWDIAKNAPWEPVPSHLELTGNALLHAKRLSGEGHANIEIVFPGLAGRPRTFIAEQVVTDKVWPGEDAPAGTPGRKIMGYRFIERVGEGLVPRPTPDPRQAVLALEEWLRVTGFHRPPDHIGIFDEGSGMLLDDGTILQAPVRPKPVAPGATAGDAPGPTPGPHPVFQLLGARVIPGPGVLPARGEIDVIRPDNTPGVWTFTVPRHGQSVLRVRDPQDGRRFFMAISRRGHLMLWKRRRRESEYLRLVAAPDQAKDIRMDGDDYAPRVRAGDRRVAAESPTTRRPIMDDDSPYLYEVTRAFGREHGTGERATAEEADNRVPRGRFLVGVDDNNDLIVQGAGPTQREIENGAYFPFGKAGEFECAVDEEKWTDPVTGKICRGRVRVFFHRPEQMRISTVYERRKVRTKQVQQPDGTYKTVDVFETLRDADGQPLKKESCVRISPYAMMEFDSREQLIGEGRRFRLARGHYHEVRIVEPELVRVNNAMPGNPDFLWWGGIGFAIGSVAPTDLTRHQLDSFLNEAEKASEDDPDVHALVVATYQALVAAADLPGVAADRSHLVRIAGMVTLLNNHLAGAGLPPLPRLFDDRSRPDPRQTAALLGIARAGKADFEEAVNILT